MKQRFSSLDVKVIAHELSQELVSLRLANIHDLSSRIMLFKFAKPEIKKQVIINSGFWCHLTDFARTTAASPSPFVARLRSFLRTRRVTSVGQVGTDRVLEFKFGDGSYRLFLEFYAGGNVILTDAELKILALLRNVSEGEGQEQQRIGLTYLLENRKNFGGVPPLTIDRLDSALRNAIAMVERSTAKGKPMKVKPGEELRKALAFSIGELPPILIDHVFRLTNFNSRLSPAEILQDSHAMDDLLDTLLQGRKILDEFSSSPACTGYIFAKRKDPANVPVPSEGSLADHPIEEPTDIKRTDLLYEDFQPFIPHKLAQDTSCHISTFDTYNKAVDDFFSSIEGQKLETRVNERELAARNKIESAERDLSSRISGLQEIQTLNDQKAAAIEANIERVQEAIDAINGLIEQGMDWVDIGKLVDREQKRANIVAQTIKLPLRLAENTITLILAEEDDEDEGEKLDATDSSSDDEPEEARKTRQNKVEKRLTVDINLELSPWGNAREYYDQKRTAAVKQNKTVQQSKKALKSAEHKIIQSLHKALKEEKALVQPIRQPIWFEKFLWFISSDGYLVLGGRDSTQSEILYRRHLRKGDVYCHADLSGAASVVVKNNVNTQVAPIPPATLSQAGCLSVCASSAWDSKAGMSAWWVAADQVSKSAIGGDFLPPGTFSIRGSKNFLPPAQLILGLGVVFRISEDSKAHHHKHRHQESPVANQGDQSTPESAQCPESLGEMDASAERGSSTLTRDDAGSLSGSDLGDDEVGFDSSSRNPLQSQWPGGDLSEMESRAQAPAKGHASDEDGDEEAGEAEGTLELTLGVTGDPSDGEDAASDVKQQNDLPIADEDGSTTVPNNVDSTDINVPGGTDKPTPKKQAPKRGQRSKEKKIATKYKYQDEEDRVAAEALLGARAGRQKADAEALARAQRETALDAARERRRVQHQRQQQQTAEHETMRQNLMREGPTATPETAAPDLPEEAEWTFAVIDELVGTPQPRDEILEAMPVCAPWSALARCKYRAKLQPGTTKKGKAVREVLQRWQSDVDRKGAVDDAALDRERVWPREAELLKILRADELVNCVPVGKVRVMMAAGPGGAGRGDGPSRGSAGGHSKGGRGGRGSKR